MEIEINNLIAHMQGRKLNIYQRADALIEFNKLIEHTESLEKKLNQGVPHDYSRCKFKTTEIVFKYPCGDTVVKYRADYGSDEAQKLMDQIKHKSKYFYRHV